MSEAREAAILRAIEEVAARTEVAGRLEPPGGEDVLRSVVEAAVAVYDAQAASLAFHEPASGRLVIRVAAGPAGAGAVGLSLASGEGIAGYVFTTGQPLAVGDVTADARFDRSAAERTGYIPRSILAVPLLDDEGAIGVMEVLDRRSEDRSALRDLELASVFARQATAAFRAGRVERATTELLRQVLVRLAADPAADGAALAALVAEAAAGLDDDGDGRLWTLADAVARARQAAPDQVALVVEILDAVARKAARPAPRTFRR
jgi:GAF domain-containing protein